MAVFIGYSRRINAFLPVPVSRIRRAVAGLSGLLLAFAVFGGEDPEAVLLEPVVVTASRLELPPGQVAVATSVFDADDLDDSPALTADDFLRQVPEFSLFRRTSSLAANPTTQGFTLRGIGPSGTSRGLVLYDGAPLNDAFGAHTKVHAGIENVFDRRYVDGRPGEDLATLGQPRLLTAGATVSF